MLQNDSMAILRKHSWVYYLQRGNKSQKIKRTKVDSNIAFVRLSLLAQKLPNDLFQEIFNRKNIAMLLTSMQRFKEEKDKEEERMPDLRTADFLVQHGLDIMIKEYKKLSWYTPEIAQLTLDHLFKTKSICSDIALSAETAHLEIEARLQNRQYLFTWKQLSQKDYIRLRNFSLSLIDNKTLHKMTTVKGELDIKYINQTDFKFEGYFVDPIKYPNLIEDEDFREGEISIELNISNSTAILELSIPNRIISKTLSIEYRNDDYYFYSG